MPTTDPPDVELSMYQKIWQVLLAYTPWAAEFQEGNIIRFDVDESNADQNKKQSADGDYPEAYMVPISGASSGATTDPTFGTYSDQPCGDFIEDQTHNFRLTITSTKLTLLEQSPLRKLTLNALRLAGPKLGLDYVTSVTWRWTVTQQPAKENRDGEGEDPTYRMVTNIDISIRTQTPSSILTGAS